MQRSVFLFIGGFDSSALCRSRQELSNAYFVAKFGFDTAVNEPFHVCPFSAYRSPRCSFVVNVTDQRPPLLDGKQYRCRTLPSGATAPGAEPYRLCKVMDRDRNDP